MPRDVSPDHPLLDRLHLLMHHVRQRMNEASREAVDGLAPVEARVLSYFARRPGHTQRDVAAHSGRDKAQIARIVRTLQERGLLRSETDPTDGRVLRLHPTDAGRTVQHRLHEQRVAIEAEMTAGLTAEQQRQLLDHLDRLLDTAERPR